MQDSEDIDQHSKFSAFIKKVKQVESSIQLEDNIMANIHQFELAKKRNKKLFRRTIYCFSLALLLGIILSNLNSPAILTENSAQSWVIRGILIACFLFLLDKLLIMTKTSPTKRFSKTL